MNALTCSRHMRTEDSFDKLSVKQPLANKRSRQWQCSGGDEQLLVYSSADQDWMGV